jgi:hypothetical protein
MRTLSGYWAYTLQGLLYWVNPFNLSADVGATLEVGVVLKGQKPPDGDLYKKYEHFAYVPLGVTSMQPFVPPPPDAPGSIYWEDYGESYAPNFDDTSPTIKRRPKMVQEAYLPFVESGHMRFHREGTITGKLRLTIAGVPTAPLVLAGRYRFSPPDAGDIFYPEGQISLLFPALHGFVWDYSFIMVSNDEMQIITLGRNKRPATASGTMKRILEGAFVEPPAGPIAEPVAPLQPTLNQLNPNIKTDGSI